MLPGSAHTNPPGMNEASMAIIQALSQGLNALPQQQFAPQGLPAQQPQGNPLQQMINQYYDNQMRQQFIQGPSPGQPPMTGPGVPRNSAMPMMMGQVAQEGNAPIGMQSPEQRAIENEQLRQMLVQRFLEQQAADQQAQAQRAVQPQIDSQRAEALSTERQNRLQMFNNIQGNENLQEFASGRPLEEALATMTLIDLLKLGAATGIGFGSIPGMMTREGGENVLKNAYKPLQKGEQIPMSHLETGRPGWNLPYNHTKSSYSTPRQGTWSKEVVRPNIITDNATRNIDDTLRRNKARLNASDAGKKVGEKYEKALNKPKTPDPKKVWSDVKNTAKKNREARKVNKK